MIGSINIFFYDFDNWLESLIENFQNFNISLKNPSNDKIYIWKGECYDGPIHVALEEFKKMGFFTSSNSLTFQFWFSAAEDILTTVTKQYNILQLSFYLDGCKLYQIDLIELAVNGFIKSNRERFLIKIVDPEGTYEEIDWFKQILTQHCIQ